VRSCLVLLHLCDLFGLSGSLHGELANVKLYSLVDCPRDGSVEICISITAKISEKSSLTLVIRVLVMIPVYGPFYPGLHE